MASTILGTTSISGCLIMMNLMDRDLPSKTIILTIKEVLRTSYLKDLGRSMERAILSKESSKSVKGKLEYSKTINFSIMVPSRETFFMVKVSLCLRTVSGMKELSAMGKYKEKGLWFSRMVKFSRGKWQTGDAKKVNSHGLRTLSKETQRSVNKLKNTLRLKSSLTVQHFYYFLCFVMLRKTRSYKVQGMAESRIMHKLAMMRVDLSFIQTCWLLDLISWLWFHCYSLL